MKASVITLHTVNNYGSALQTYATQKVLEDLGLEVEFVDYWRRDNRGRYAVDKALNSPSMQKYKKYWDRHGLTRRLVRLPLSLMLWRKRAPMRRFISRRIHLTPRSYYSFDELLRETPQADVYITGSDQVWNSVWNQGIEKPFFLEYAPPGKLRIAFSASIGREKLDESEVEVTREMLLKYHRISMREKSGVELLQKLGIPSQQILDPTLMLNREQWREIAVPCREKWPYLLVYQLNANAEMDAYAERLAQSKDWEILRISYGYSGKQKKGKCIVCPSVEKLLGYFLQADCVLTDSFHATAFSLNLSRNFVSILPERFGTRIRSITELTGTQDHVLTDYQDLSVVEKAIDFQRVQDILDRERTSARRFLTEALGLQP